MRHTFFILSLLPLSACTTLEVRQSDLDTWRGQPVSALETHPVFVSIPVVKTVASDGTEIWNYVNGVDIGKCSSGGAIFGSVVDYATYSGFQNCISRKGACNNLFYIEGDTVVRYSPVGTGGVNCYTDERVRPGFAGPTNIR